MQKNIHTKREDLICGKLDAIAEEAIHLGAFKASEKSAVRIIDILNLVRSDVYRMEKKLVERKAEAIEYERCISELKKNEANYGL